MILPDETPAPRRDGPPGEGGAEKLRNYTGVVPWSYLRPHCERETLLYVDPSLRLEEVGAALAANDAARVRAWLKSGDLVRMGGAHAAQWAHHPAKEFEALVVSPFVLCRPAHGSK